MDAHHHIWRQADLAWLQGPPQPRIFGEYAAIRRDYPIEEYMAEARAAGVARSVYVQTNWPAGREEEEVAWVQSVADRHGFPHAIVGYADLAAPAVGATLDRMMKHAARCAASASSSTGTRSRSTGSPRGPISWTIRRGAPGSRRWRGAGCSSSSRCSPARWRRAARLVRDFPQATFVLMHAGMLEDRSPEGWTRWRAGMRALAAAPNVHVKLSGLGTFARACSVELWSPVIRETVELFGPGRCMFGSNFPIEKLWTTYDEVVRVTTACLAGLSAGSSARCSTTPPDRVYRLAS